jgi:predicted component of type VI protein secretion system
MRLVALHDGSDILVDKLMIVVGRHPTCDIRLNSRLVSRRHCSLARDKDELEVRDLGSRNGIRINGHRVERGRLRAGDELSIAHFCYELDTSLGEPRMTPIASGSPITANHQARDGTMHHNITHES